MIAETPSLANSLWGEREVRRLLRRLRRPHLLEHEPLAIALRQHYRTEFAVDACVRALRETFATQGAQGRRLFGIIQRCDINDETHLAVAMDLNISLRQFFRYRKDAAVAALEYFRSILEHGRSERTPPVMKVAELIAESSPESARELYHSLRAGTEPGSQIAGVFDIDGDGIDAILAASSDLSTRIIWMCDVAAFHFVLGNRQAGRALIDRAKEELFATKLSRREEIELHVLRAVLVEDSHYESAERYERTASQFRRSAASSEQLCVQAMLWEVAAAIGNGNLGKARGAIGDIERITDSQELRQTSILVCMEGMADFMECNYAAAEQLLRVAGVALRDRALDALMIDGHLGRACLFLGRPWPDRSASIRLDDLRHASTALRGGVLITAGAQTAFSRLYRDLVRVRYSAGADPQAALAELGALEPLCRRFPVLDAYARATRATLLSQLNGDAAAQTAFVEAFEKFLEVRDYFFGHDMFNWQLTRARRFGPVDPDNAFLDVLFAHLQSEFPMVPLLREGNDEMPHRLWRELLMDAHWGEERDASQPISPAGRNGASADSIARNRGPFCERAANAAAVFVSPPSRPAFKARFATALNALYDRALRSV